MARRKLTGIEIRHARTCSSRDGVTCDCKPTFQANIWSARDGKRIRKTFPTSAAAQGWRADALVALRRGTLRTPSRRTLREAATELVEGMRSGLVRTRSGDPYKPSAIRSYKAALDQRIVPDLAQRASRRFVARTSRTSLIGSWPRGSILRPSEICSCRCA